MKIPLTLSRSKHERGQGFAEYALLLMFIGISTILVMSALNSVIAGQFTDINQCMHNRGSRALTSGSCEEAVASSSGSTTSTTGSTTSSTGSTTSTTGSTTSTTGSTTSTTGSTTSTTGSTTSTTGSTTSTTGSTTSTTGSTTSTTGSTTSTTGSTTSSTGSTTSSTGSTTSTTGSTTSTTGSTTSTTGSTTSTTGSTTSTTGSTTGSTNTAPIANFSSNCNNLTCSFTNTASDDGGAGALTSSWTFGDSSSSTNTSPSKTYAGSGSYNVTLTVTDAFGLSNSISKTVAVIAANTPPTAVINNTCLNLTCDFSGSASTDNGSIVSYAWNFGDSTTGSGVTTSKTFSGAGTFTVTLTVTDNGGLTNTATKNITVTAPNAAPTANFTVPTCAASSACIFTNTSTDDGGTGALSSSWSFGDSSSSTTASPSKIYAAVGTYNVTLTVTDAGGLTNSVTKSVTVTAPTATTMSIEAVSATASTSGSNWTGSVTFTVLNNLNAPVNNVTVTISVSPTAWNTGSNLSCVTNASGTCTLTSASNKKSGGGSVASYAVTITGLSGGGLTYVPANNSDTTDGINTLTSTTTLNITQTVNQ